MLKWKCFSGQSFTGCFVLFFKLKQTSFLTFISFSAGLSQMGDRQGEEPKEEGSFKESSIAIKSTTPALRPW